jgi:hypothetical protein
MKNKKIHPVEFFNNNRAMAKAKAIKEMKKFKKSLVKAQEGISTDSTKIYNQWAKEDAILSKEFENKGDKKGANMAMDVMMYHLDAADRQKNKGKAGFDKYGFPLSKKKNWWDKY